MLVVIKKLRSALRARVIITDAPALAARRRHTRLGPQQRHANGSGEVADVSYGDMGAAARGEKAYRNQVNSPRPGIMHHLTRGKHCGKLGRRRGKHR